MSLFSNVVALFRRVSDDKMMAPTLDSDARIRVTLLQESPIVVGAAAPVSVDALAGKVIWHDTTKGHAYLYDVPRSKWLSMAEFPYFFGGDSEGNNTWRTACINSLGTGGDPAGYRIPHNLTVVRATAATRARGGTPKTWQLFVNGVFSPGGLTGTFDAGGLQGTIENHDLAEGDVVHVRGSAGNTVSDVELTLFSRWRG